MYHKKSELIQLSAKAKKYTCMTAQFCGGGIGYGLLEILWRGYTHFSMLVAGGLGLILLVKIAKMNQSLVTKSVIGGLCITAVEFITGCIVNLFLGLAVWDYTGMPLSFMGQICLGFTLLWVALSAAVILCCRLWADVHRHVQTSRAFKNNKKSERLSAQ